MPKVALAAIEITGCDPEKVKRASKSAKQFVFPFSLTTRPHEDWVDLFERVWDARRKKLPARKTRARVRRGEILLECSLSDVKLVFDEVRQCVGEANTRYAEDLREKAEKTAKRKQKEKAERLSVLSAVREALDGIEYSDSTSVAAAKPTKTRTEKPRRPAEG
ncbi:MAG TPA: hypothetical protein VLU47_06710 [Blastocatellia bacterium]|nr:hypothetical protein [Blastocatellia bacterium]